MNFKEMCRTCLRSGEVMSSIFDEEIEPAKHTAAELLAVFTSVQVDKEDNFPHNICNICLKEIQQAYLFDLKCKKSEIILHQLRDIRINLKKLNVIPKQNEMVSEVASELESILKEAKLEDVMWLCDRNISDSECNASGRIGSVKEENANAKKKLNFRIVEKECTPELQVAFKRKSEQSNHFMKDESNLKDVVPIQIVSNFQIVEDDWDPQITLKQEPDHNSLITRNSAFQNDLEPNQNSSNFEIYNECDSEYKIIINKERDHSNIIITDTENGEEFESSEISSNFQIVDAECVPDYHVTFKSEPELDIGIDCYDEQLECSACLKQFDSLDMFRGHIVSDHLDENICKLCNEEFECSQFEHTAKHFPFTKPKNPSGSSEESIKQTGRVHMKALHKEEFLNKPDLQCKICSKIFANRYRLLNHVRTHTGKKPLDCELCAEKFENSATLLYHKRTKHTEKMISADKPVPDLQCNVCNKVFGQKHLLRYHMRIHTGEKPYDCEFCPEKFGNRPTLIYHKRTKHTDKMITADEPVPDIQCNVCNKVFGQKFLLRNHVRTHTGEKPYDCEFCPEKFGNSATLRNHKRTKHTDKLISDNKPVPDFQCNVCNKVFGQKYILRYHMRTHTGEKPYDCEFCPEKFGNGTTLLYHKRTKHTDKLISDNKPVPDIQCNVCNKVFGQKYLLRNHMRTHTGEKPYDCEFCPEKFGNSATLLYHKRTKHTDKFISDNKPVPDFQCNVCNKVVGKKHQLKNHMRVHTGEKPFHCKLCLSKFSCSTSLKRHVKEKHSDEKPEYKCKVCSKVFGFKSNLRKHMRLHSHIA